MKKKYAILNFVLMLSVLFAVSYQSLHTLHHHISQTETVPTSSKSTNNKSKITISEKENCSICDFKFASFLSPEIFTYSFFFPFKESPYSFSVKEDLSFFCGSLYCLRGPPSLI